ncbi:hypothetical protein ACFW1A_04665 [Kitasatospora sp. NPDC058965]|uniref:hypothetical protein n=1 Tax=Kitasatospora sp. NPDC058965 TaxID=3346682 RepID=UPI00368E4E16
MSVAVGKVTVARIACRGGGVADLQPAGAVLGLSAGMHGYGPAGLVALGAFCGPFAGARGRVGAVTGAGSGR